MKAGTKKRPEIPTLTRTNSKQACELRQLFREPWQKKKVATENSVATFFSRHKTVMKTKAGCHRHKGETQTQGRDTDTGERHRHKGEPRF